MANFLQRFRKRHQRPSVDLPSFSKETQEQIQDLLSEEQADEIVAETLQKNKKVTKNDPLSTKHS